MITKMYNSINPQHKDFVSIMKELNEIINIATGSTSLESVKQLFRTSINFCHFKYTIIEDLRLDPKNSHEHIFVSMHDNYPILDIE